MPDHEQDIWEIKPRGDIAEQLTNEALNPPSEVEIMVTLTGNSAARYHFARKLLMLAFQLSQEEADRYLTRAGAEREIERLALLWNRQEQPPA
jgi:hypothetical protein